MKNIVRDQYRSRIDQLLDREKIERPKEGWIRSLRKALGMSGPQLAQRIGVSKARVSQMERMEIEDRITLKQLRRVADSLDCDLTYAIVPRQPIDELVRGRALVKAKELVGKVDTHMKLEKQQLSRNTLQDHVEAEAQRLFREMPRDLWAD